MGLFTRRTSEEMGQPYYEITSNPQTGSSLVSKNTVLLVGLGNVGKKYDGTRHNVGFECIDSFVEGQGFPAWTEKKDLKCLITKHSIGKLQIIAIKPTTYMNESGQAVAAVQRYFKVNNSSTIVVHDDLDVAFGQIRTRIGGGSAGNNGIKSLIQHINEDFGRIRIGVKNDLLGKMDSADFVLAKFSKDEQANMIKLKREVSALLSEFTASGELPHDTRNFLL